MRKGLVAKLGAGALALSLITASLVGGTFAKYTSSVTGTGTATVAKWDVKFAEGNGTTDLTDFTFDLVDTSANAANVKDGMIAPGSTGQVTLKINGTGTEVAYAYKINITNSDLKTVKFYRDAERTTEITAEFGDTVAVDATEKVTTVPIYWEWVDADDAADTTASTLGTKTFTVAIAAEQITTP